MLRFATVAVGEGPATACVRCAATAPAVYRDVADIETELHAIVADWHDGPGPNVTLGGPEPFGHPDLPSVVAACTGVGVRRIAIETAGDPLAVHGNAPGILHAGVTHVDVRVPALGILGDELTGRPGAVARAEAGVRLYVAAAQERSRPAVVTVVVPVCSHNVRELPATIAGLALWGVDAVRLVRGGGSRLPDSAEAFVSAACDTGMVNRLWVETDGSLPLPVTHYLHDVTLSPSAAHATGTPPGFSAAQGPGQAHRDGGGASCPAR